MKILSLKQLKVDFFQIIKFINFMKFFKFVFFLPFKFVSIIKVVLGSKSKKNFN